MFGKDKREGRVGKVLRDVLVCEVRALQNEIEASGKAAAWNDALARLTDTVDTPPVRELCALEKDLLSLYDEVLLRRKAWLIRDRFARAAGPTAYQKYLESSPPKAEDGAREVLIADLKALIDATSTCYVFAEVQEAKLAAIKRWGLTLVASMGVLTAIVGYRKWGSGGLSSSR